MAKVTLSVTDYSNADIVTTGDVYRVGRDSPAVPGKVKVKPTKGVELTLERGSYTYEFNVTKQGKFNINAATPPPPGKEEPKKQSKPIDTVAGGQEGQTFDFKVFQ